MKFTIGLDPEFMLTYNGKYISAIGVIRADKYNRIQYNGHQYYYDNVMAECAVKPSASKEEFICNLTQCLSYYAKMVAPYKLTIRAFNEYPTSQLLDEEAREVGCKLEYCAYLLDEVDNSKIEKIIKKSSRRSAGGHIHLGAKELQDGFTQVFSVRMLDLFLGLPLMLIDKDPTAAMRRKLYGQAGRHRRPPHGLEYRTPGNYWLSSPKLANLVYDLCQFVLSFVEEEKHFQFWTVADDVFTREDWANAHQCHGYDLKKLRMAIDTSNVTKGCEFLPFIKKYLPSKLFRDIHKFIQQDGFDFYKEWAL